MSYREEEPKPIFVEFRDQDENAAWTQREDAVLHIELRKLSALLLIAPLSANSLAKMTQGICNNLLLSVFRCWDLKNISRTPVVVAPAMNTFMFEHPITDQ